MDGVRLLSHRPSVLYKVEHLATEPATGDIAVEGLLLAGPGWDERLKSVIRSLSISERACLFAVRLADEQGLPVPAETLLDRTRTDWFPEFLSHGQMRTPFQPTADTCQSPMPSSAWKIREPVGTRAVQQRLGADWFPECLSS